ncbi:MAG: hypothetical protein V3S43_06345 [Acidimicrobiia bacterium]
MTGAELVTLTKTESGNRTSTTRTDPWFLDRVNEAYRWLATYKNEASTGGTRTVRFQEFHQIITRTISASPATNFLANSTRVYANLVLYNVTDDRPMHRKPLLWMQRRSRTETGSVAFWTPYGESDVSGYLFWRVPTTAVTLHEHVYRYPEALLDGAVAPVIPESWHDIIYTEAAARAALLGNDKDLYDKLHVKAIEAIETRGLPFEEARQGPGLALIMERGV